MLTFLRFSCKSSMLNPPTTFNNFITRNPNQNRAISSIPRSPRTKTPSCSSVSVNGSCKNLFFCTNLTISKSNHVCFCSKKQVLDEFTNTHMQKDSENEKNQDVEELELRVKPSPKQVFDNEVVVEEEVEDKKPNNEEALEPFLRFFRPTEEDSIDSQELADKENSTNQEKITSRKKVSVEYYDPKPGDFVVGVVVSGNGNKLDVNIGADLLGTMLTKEVLPLYDKEMDYLLCDRASDAEKFMVKGKIGIMRNEEAISGRSVSGRPVVEPGTVLFAEVLGRTLSGRPLISVRKFFRRLAWHRVRQIKQLNEPLEVKITEWNTGGLLTRIEGLRAFLPKDELINRVNSFRELKENVGRELYVQITRIEEDTNDLILSEKEAWTLINLKVGTLLEGTVKRIYPYGAQIRIGETNRSGLLHISNMTRARVTSVSDLLAVDEKVKVLVIKPLFPDKISLSIAELESEPGLFLSDKERVFSEAEEMAKKYREKLPTTSLSATAGELESLSKDALPYEDEANLYSNWNWFIFERHHEQK